MKYKVLYILILVFFIHLTLHAQRGQRIAYIDTEYILQNVPDYQEANAQLDKKVQEWKSEIDKKLSAIATKKQELEAERILLTKELYEERLEDIQIEENEILDYQQKRFGPEGDYITQKNQLVQPIQDQIFATVQEIAESRNYDFIFDKSADLTMLFSAKQYDVSEFVLRSITRSANRKQAQTKQERKAAEEEELVPEINTSKEERQLALAEKRAAREKEIEARRQQQLEEREAAKAAAEARRQQIMEERAKAREAKMGNRAGTGNNETSTNKETADKQEEGTQKSAKELMEEQRAQKLKEREELRKKALEARQGNTPPSLKDEEETKDEKTTEEKTVQPKKTDTTQVKQTKTPAELMEEERQKKLKEREEKRQAILNAKKQQTDPKVEEKTEKTADSTKTDKPMTAQEKMEAERQKKIEERERRRKELEERKQKILEERKKQREQQEAEKKTDTTKNNN